MSKIKIHVRKLYKNNTAQVLIQESIGLFNNEYFGTLGINEEVHEGEVYEMEVKAVQVKETTFINQKGEEVRWSRITLIPLDYFDPNE